MYICLRKSPQHFCKSFRKSCAGTYKIPGRVCMYMYIHIHTYTYINSIYMCIYIYIYMQFPEDLGSATPPAAVREPGVRTTLKGG